MKHFKPTNFKLKLGKHGADFDTYGLLLSLTFSIVSNQQAIVYFSISGIHKTRVCFPTIFRKHAKTCQANITIRMEPLAHFHSLHCDAALINEVNACTKRKAAMLSMFLQALRKTKKGERETGTLSRNLFHDKSFIIVLPFWSIYEQCHQYMYFIGNFYELCKHV